MAAKSPARKKVDTKHAKKVWGLMQTAVRGSGKGQRLHTQHIGRQTKGETKYPTREQFEAALADVIEENGGTADVEFQLRNADNSIATTKKLLSALSQKFPVVVLKTTLDFGGGDVSGAGGAGGSPSSPDTPVFTPASKGTPGSLLGPGASPPPMEPFDVIEPDPTAALLAKMQEGVTPGPGVENTALAIYGDAADDEHKHDKKRKLPGHRAKGDGPKEEKTERDGKEQKAVSWEVGPDGKHLPEDQSNADAQKESGQGVSDAQPNGGIGAAFGQHLAAKTYRAAQTDTVIGQSTRDQTQQNRPGEKDDLKMASGSDQIIGGPQTQNNALATMRPLYPQPNGSEVVPSAKKQLQSDIAFDMFSVVRPGFGLGADNKLFVQQDIWEKKIQGMDPHTMPRGNGGGGGGPECGIKPAPWPLQNVMSKGQINHMFDRVNKRTHSIANIVRSTPTRTIGALPNDIVGVASAKGLKRKPSPLEPIYNQHEAWLPYNESAGVFLNRRGFKHQYNPMRTPLRVEHDPLNGMQTLNKRRALEVILQ